MLIVLYVMIGLGLGFGSLNKQYSILRFLFVTIFWPFCLAFLLGLKLSE